MSKFNRLILIAAMAAAPLGLANAADSDSLTWYVTPYLFAPGVTVDLHTNPDIDIDPDYNSESDFSDIIDKLDMAFMGHVEAQGDAFGAYADVLYVDFGDSKDYEYFRSNSDFSTVVLDLAGVWSPGEGRYKGLELIGGLRHIRMDFEANLIPDNTDNDTRTVGSSQNFTDFMLGARYLGEFNPTWGYGLHADGSWGDTDGTLNLSAMLTYKLKSGVIEGGYRYMDVQLPVGNNGGDLDIALSGLVLGYSFVF